MSDSQFYNASDKDSTVTLEEWTDRHPVDFADAHWRDDEFGAFMKTQIFPNVLRTEAIMRPLRARLLSTDYGETGLFFLDSWCNRRLADKTFEDGDRYELEMWLTHIACSWMSSVSKRVSKKSSYACRNGIVNLLELAFQLRAGANQEWQQDAELVLPDEPDSVVADTIATAPLPEYWQDELKRLYPTSWSYTEKPGSVITFIFVASKDDSDEQSTRERLQMCFYSAQKHRRALCLEDAPVFGAILHDGILDTFISMWEDDRLVVRPILRRYTIEFFSDFVECYFVLCRIAEYTSDYLTGQLEHWWAGRRQTKQRIIEACKHSWRSERRGGIALEVCNTSKKLDNTGIQIDISKLDCVHDRFSRILLASVLQVPSPPQSVYPLTRKNKKVFDIIMDLDDENEGNHLAYDTAVWAEDTYEYRGEYEDPAPISDDCDNNLNASPPSPHPPVESKNSIPTARPGQTGTQSGCLASVTNLRDAEPPGDMTPDVKSPNSRALMCKASSSPEGTTKKKGRRQPKAGRKLLPRLNYDIVGRRLHRAAIQVW